MASNDLLRVARGNERGELWRGEASAARRGQFINVNTKYKLLVGAWGVAWVILNDGACGSTCGGAACGI